MSDPSAVAAGLMQDAVTGCERLAGGDLSQVLRLRLASGRTVVVKAGDTARTEAAMLAAFAEAQVPAPEVVAVAPDILVLEDLGTSTGPDGAWGDTGRVVRGLHATTGTEYGWPADHRFGPVPIANAPCRSWPEFWAERRLLPMLQDVPPDLGRRIERLCSRLGDLLPAEPLPALLHGDLWSGNIMTRGGRVIGLIDPACYFGHAEVDLAMLTLFDSPGRDFWNAYGTPDPGQVERRPLYQLWPALVHLRLFGGSYRPLVDRLLDRLA